MSEAEQGELERLRSEVESYRQRELADLRAALAAAREQAEFYRNEAKRIEAIGRQIHAQAQEQITTLRAQISAGQTIANGRTKLTK